MYRLTVKTFEWEYEQDFVNYEDIVEYIESCPLDGFVQIKINHDTVKFIPKDQIAEIEIKHIYITEV